MNVLIISICIGLFVLLLLSIIDYIALGDRGKSKNISNYYKHLKGSESKKPKKVSNQDIGSILEHSTIRDYYIYFPPTCLALFIFAYIIFKSVLMGFILSLFGCLLPGILYDRNNEKIKDILTLQLRDALGSITASLKAGLSLNSAVIKCVDDLERIHTAMNQQYILQEFKKIKYDLNTGISIEDALKGFKNRIMIDDVEDFVNSILILKQKGGNLVEVMDNITKMINDKISIKNEINILTASKKMEARILTIMPVAMIVLLSLFSPSYMGIMLSTTMGKILIIIGFIMLTANYFMSQKIVDIKF